MDIFWPNTLTKQIRGHEEMNFFFCEIRASIFFLKTIFNFDFVNGAFGPMGKGAL